MTQLSQSYKPHIVLCFAQMMLSIAGRVPPCNGVLFYSFMVRLCSVCLLVFLLEFLLFRSLDSMFPHCRYMVPESVCMRVCVFLPVQQIVPHVI